MGAEGRFPKVLRLCGLEKGAQTGSPPMDVLWFDLPREPSDPQVGRRLFRVGRGILFALTDHGIHWQVGHTVKKGGARRLGGGGVLEEMRR